MSSIVFKNNIPPALNPTLNLTNSVNESKHKIKTNSLKQPCHISLLLQVFKLHYRVLFVWDVQCVALKVFSVLCETDECKCLIALVVVRIASIRKLNVQ